MVRARLHPCLAWRIRPTDGNNPHTGDFHLEELARTRGCAQIAVLARGALGWVRIVDARGVQAVVPPDAVTVTVGA